MRNPLFWTLLMVVACTDSKSAGNNITDTGESTVLCPGDSIYVEVCIECGDAGGCDEMGYECRSICDADEDCPDHEVCLSSDAGAYCDERYSCD